MPLVLSQVIAADLVLNNPYEKTIHLPLENNTFSLLIWVAKLPLRP